MAKIKVAYMMGGLNRGGAETLMLDVFRNHGKASYDMVGIHRNNGDLYDDFMATGAEIVQISPKIVGYLKYVLQLRHFIRNHRINIIHTQHWLDCIYARIATLGMKTKIVNTFHGFYKVTGWEGLLCRVSILFADSLCFVSQYEQDWYIEKCGIEQKKCRVVYNGVDFSKLNNLCTLKNELPTSDTNLCLPKIAMVGSFGPGRSQMVILRAINVLKNLGMVDFDFYFIGSRVETYASLYDECVEYRDLNQLTNVYFLGGREDVPAILREIDGFVYSTKHDTFGIAVVEAMAVGLPIVVNDWPVMLEITKGGTLATIFKSNDERDCADKICNILCAIKERNYDKQPAMQYVRSNYSISQYMDRLTKIYEEIL